MADIIYTVNQDLPENIVGFEQYSQEDKSLVDSFQINNTFNPTKDYSELHILSLSDELLESIDDFNNYKQSPAAQSAGQEGTSAITINPIEDCKFYGYDDGGVKLLYHFLNDLYSQDRSRVEFFIQDISADRTELSLLSLNIPSEELIRITSIIKSNLQSQSYFTGFRLNFRENDLFIAVNIDTLDSPTGTVVVVKLYEPLPDTYGIKSTLSIVDVVSDSLVYEIDAEIIAPPAVAPTLRSPNFNIDLVDDSVIPTKYYNYDELLSYPVNNSNSQIFSAVSEKSIDISIDHSDFSNFIHFSSAQERLLNFKYKLDLLTSYSASIAAGINATTGLQGISGSREYYQNLMTGVVSNFDHYERFLYYESGSSSWPKVNSTKPYSNEQTYLPGTLTPNPVVNNWYSNEISNAINYDNTNYNSLAYSIPTYLRDDTNNENYLTFIYMIGQHFDNLWLYSKAVTDKYDADNRLNKGISKDLVAEALKNFGVKLYTSNKSVEDLFSTFVGQAYQSGSEDINNYITGSLTGSNTPIQPSSIDNYQKEVQKRIYHNLPLLLKSKGTERGLRALINCFGIPSDIFDIKLYGGRNINERPFYGDSRFYTSSLDKIRLDNTGSIVTGSTLSQYTSIIKREYKYTDDLHSIELGFSPTDNVDNYIISKSLSTASLASFNIDDYLGDPRNLSQDSYYTFSPAGSITGSLDLLTDSIMSGSTAYDVFDFVRLIKFFDNTIFKMVKDFIPARSTASTGIIIKPHVLSRSKAKSVKLSGSRPEHTSSIDTAFTEGDSGGSFNSQVSLYSTSYVNNIQTPNGLSELFTHTHEEPRFNGELNNSGIEVSDGELNRDNIYKAIENVTSPYIITFVSASDEICLLNTKAGLPSPLYITSSTATLSSTDFFTFTNASSQYALAVPATSATSASITFPTTIQSLQTNFAELTQYSTGSIKVNNTNYTLGTCTSSIDFIYATCSLGLTQYGQDLTEVVVSPYPNLGDIETNILPDWFTYHQLQGPLSNLKFEITIGASTTTISNDPAVPNSIYNYQFDPSFANQSATITLSDPKAGPGCRVSKTVLMSNCAISTIATGSRGLPFVYSKQITGNIGAANLSNEFTDLSNLETNEPGRNLLGYSTTVLQQYNTNNIRYIEVSPPTGPSGRGLQSYFLQYPPDPDTRYSVFFITRTNANAYNARTVIANQTPTMVEQYYTNNNIPFVNNISTVGAGNTPIRIVTPFETLDQELAVRAIVIEAYPPESPQCKRRVTLYPSTGAVGVSVVGGNAVFQLHDMYLDWNSSLLGTPLLGSADILAGVPIRI